MAIIFIHCAGTKEKRRGWDLNPRFPKERDHCGIVGFIRTTALSNPAQYQTMRPRQHLGKRLGVFYKFYQQKKQKEPE